jgi:hypothetical protein
MAQITGGKFHYLRVVKDDDFGIKREFQAELTFSVGENESPDEIMGFVAQKVVDVTHEKLRIRSAAPTGAAAGEVQAKPGSPPLAPLPAAAPAPVNDKEKLAAALVEKTTPKKGKKAPDIAAAAPADDLDDLLGGGTPKPAAKPITDKELNDAVQAKNATLKNPPKIVALKEKYAGALPKSLRDIPQEKRAEFLTELAELA